MDGKFLPFDEIPIGSIWMAADGGNYGYVVAGRRPSTKDILVKGFTASKGWEVDGPEDIDWYKLQYRYYMVHKGP